MGPEIDLLNETARYIPPMLEDEFYLTYASEMEASKKNKQAATLSKALVPVVGMNHTLWAAAKDNQVSMEGNLSGQIRGYFTYHFKILRATNGNIVRKTLDRQVAVALAAMGAAQINQTESISSEFSQKIFT
jgi:glycerol-3-phosphate O-acyltransferase